MKKKRKATRKTEGVLSSHKQQQQNEELQEEGAGAKAAGRYKQPWKRSIKHMRENANTGNENLMLRELFATLKLNGTKLWQKWIAGNKRRRHSQGGRGRCCKKKIEPWQAFANGLRKLLNENGAAKEAARAQSSEKKLN